MLNLYNTLTKKIETLPKKEHINLYTCGPTVYNYAHIGNLRSYILADLLYRTLKVDGYHPRWVMNITDVDDKTIRDTIKKFGPRAGVKELREFTDFYFDAFRRDMREVNVSTDEIKFIRVADVIPQIQRFVIGLVKKGMAYAAEDGIYFSIEKYQKEFGDYGELVGQKFLEGKKTGARVAVDEYEKDNLSDFALWKAHNSETDGQIFWTDEVNDPSVKIMNGRPGWHIECSVINQIGFNGEVTDIHTGGVDLIFPHHTNEIAQSQGLLGKNQFVSRWFHSEHLQVDGQRMGKRFNNFYTLSDLKQKGFNGQDLRYFFLTSSYNGQQNFTLEGLQAVKTARIKLFRLWGKEQKNIQAFEFAMNGNLNAPQALSAVWSGNASRKQIIDGLGLMAEDAQELIISPDAQRLIDLRAAARQAKDFKKSDELRGQIEAMGYEVLDTAEGQKIKKKLAT